MSHTCSKIFNSHPFFLKFVSPEFFTQHLPIGAYFIGLTRDVFVEEETAFVLIVLVETSLIFRMFL